MSDVLKMTKEENLNYNYNNNQAFQYNPYYTEKSPGVAFLLSFLVIGGGQYYNGEIGKGVVMDVLAVGEWIMMLNGFSYEDYYYDGYYEYEEESYEPNGFFYAGWATIVGTALWSWIDAPVSAIRINEENRRQGNNQPRRFGHLFEINHDDNTFGFDFLQTKKMDGAKASFTYHF